MGKVILEKIAILVFCHLLGDYVLQVRFIADSKGKNWYHMFIHCVLYCFPFWVFFGLSWQLVVVFVTHMIIDPMKARWGLIGYTSDQVAHYGILTVYLFNDMVVWDVVLAAVLAGSIINLVCDIIFFRDDHYREMTKYYRELEDGMGI